MASEGKSIQKSTGITGGGGKVHKERKPLRPSKEAFEYEPGGGLDPSGVGTSQAGDKLNANHGHGRHGVSGM